MTDDEIMRSGPPEAVSYFNEGYYAYKKLMVKHPAGWRTVNHAQIPYTVAQCQSLARKLFPTLPFIRNP